jgi:hypothetical protein
MAVQTLTAALGLLWASQLFVICSDPEARRSRMSDTDKIVAAILASGYAAAKTTSDISVEFFIETYERVLHEMAKRDAGLAGKGAIARHKKEEGPR